MTLLNWQSSEERIDIFTDTLCCHSNGQPRNHVGKAYPMQHLGLVVAGTGLAQLILRWAMIVQGDFLGPDIVALDSSAPETLREVALAIGGPTDRTTTLYTFGWAAAEGRFVNFAYRSETRFASERLPYAMYLKPPPIDTACLTAPDFSFDQVVRQQYLEDGALPMAKRVGIGGDLLHYQLSRTLAGETQIASTRAFRF